MEKYSIIVEGKADILGDYAVPYFAKVFSLGNAEIKKHNVTYVSDLIRSIRFGVHEAYGSANLIQLNFMTNEEVINRVSH